MKLTLPKVGTWGLPGLLQLQSSIVEVKTPCLEVFFIPLERPWSVDVENGLAWAIRTFAAQVMVERRGVKLAVWFPTTKSRESTWPWCVQTDCDTPFESFWGKLQDCFKPHPNPRSEPGVTSSQSLESYELPKSRELQAPKVPGIQTGTISRLLLGSPKNKNHLDASVAEQCREYYMGEGGGFPRVQAVVSQVSPCCPWLILTPKVFPKVN
jgi:hypothetical protein